MTPQRRLVETFNTHRMSDEVVRELASGRDQEMAEIMPAIRQAAADPQAPPPAMIVYGERGSGKSFLLRMVQIECAAIEGLACVLLPEEQYNLRAPQQLLQVVTAQLRGQGWSTLGWKIPFSQIDEAAWNQALQDFQAAMDARFGPGRGLAVVLLENFDALVESLFGAKPAPKSVSQGAALARRQAEERLRKLMNARGGRFMLVASATGTVDMDYERPLFQAFHPVDLRGWPADTAIDYFNKRRRLDGLEPLSPAEQARARAIVLFIGGNPRLAQLLGTVLATPDAHTIAQTLDALVDHLADYYRRRMDSLPLAAASVLDEMIRGGEPVSQTALGQRMGGEQRHIADAFNYLVRGRLVQAIRAGAAQLYRVRDRLFVHFYHRRYGNAQGLAAIAELLEGFFTPEEREQEIRHRLERGEYADARAFGRLPLAEGAPDYGYNRFRDGGISDGPASVWFSLAGVPEAEVEPRRQELRDQPARAYTRWHGQARGASPLPAAAAGALAAVAASRQGLDQLAAHELADALAAARADGDPDALIVALDAAAIFEWHCQGERGGGQARCKAYSAEAAGWLAQAISPQAKAIAAIDSAFAAWHQGQFRQAQEAGLALDPLPELKLRLLHGLAQAQFSLGRYEETIATCRELQALARTYQSLDHQTDACTIRALALDELQRPEQALEAYQEGAALADRLGDRLRQVKMTDAVGWKQGELKQWDPALTTGREVEALALSLDPPLWLYAARGTFLQAIVLLNSDARSNAQPAAGLLPRAADQAGRTENHALFDYIVELWVWLGTQTPQPSAITALGQALDRQPDLQAPSRADWQVPNTWPLAMAKAGAWAEAVALAHRHPGLLQQTPEDAWTAATSITAEAWAATAATAGRAAAYALTARALPEIWTLWTLRAKVSGQDPAALARQDLNRMTSALLKEIRDPGLLRDLADLAADVCGPAAEETANQLRAFAGVHEAKDKTASLQRLDPDLATAIRVILDLPEPSESTTTLGRQRAR